MTSLTPRTLQILLALVDGALHGYGIKQRVEERTAGSMVLGSGTLYEAIARLLDAGFVEEVPAPSDEPSPGGPPRRFYSITAEGRRELAEELRQMEDVVRFAKAKNLVGERPV